MRVNGKTYSQSINLTVGAEQIMDHGPIGRQTLLQEMHIHKLIHQPFTGIIVQ